MGSSSSSRFDGRIPRSASSRRDRSPPDSDAHLLEHVVAAEQEPREVAAGLAGRDRDRLEDRVEDRRAGDRRVAELREVRGRDVVPERDRAVEGGQVARDRAQQRRLAGAVGPHDPDPLPALRGEERRAGHGHGLRPRRSRRAAAPRDPAGSRPRGPRAGSPSRPSARDRRRGRCPAASAPCPPSASRRAARAASRASPRARASSRACAGSGSAGRARSRARSRPRATRTPAPPGRRAPRAGGGTTSSRRGTPSGAGRAAPRRGTRSRRGTPGRARRRGAPRPGGAGAPRAIRSRRCPGGWSARRGGAGPGRR